MNSTPRRWVLKPLSPLLQPSDLRTIAGPTQGDAPHPGGPVSSPVTNNHLGLFSSRGDGGSQDQLVQVQQVFRDGESTGDESQPSSPGSSSGSHCGFYSFVEDPQSQEAGLNEAWMVSSQRQSQLFTLKEEKGFKLQTYSGSRRPESLFDESNQESRYKVDPQNLMGVVGEEEEKRLRMEIIQTQAPKKNPMFTDQLQVLENLDLSRSPDRLMKGFSVSYSSISSRPEPLEPAELGTVNKEPINFSAARQQFLKMEQDLLTSGPGSLRSSRTRLNSFQRDPEASWSKQVETLDVVEGSHDPDQIKPSEGDETHHTRQNARYQTEESLSRQSSVLDDPDSGLEELMLEVGGGDTSDEDASIGHSKSSTETPIEREIRLAQEREENLRRSRGLTQNHSRKEMIQIRTKRLNSGLASVKPTVNSVEHETLIAQEPEEPQQLDQVLSGLDEPDQDLRTEERLRSGSGESEVFLSPCCPHRHPEDSPLSSFTARNSNVHVTSSSSSTSSSSTPPPLSPQLKPTRTRSHSWRENLESSGLQSRGQGAQDLLAKEIEEVLRREQELRESRRETARQLLPLSPPPVEQTAKMAAAHSLPPPAHTDNPVSLNSSSPRPPIRQPSISFITAQPWTPPPAPTGSASSTPVRAPPRPLLPRGLTDTLMQDFEERRERLKLEENSYAGILLIDNVNNEVVESTRVPRHKNQRALQWEAGLFANQQGEQDSVQEKVLRQPPSPPYPS